MMALLTAQQIFLATKFGNHVTPDGGREIRNEPEYIHMAVAESLRRLQTDYIDLLYWFVITWHEHAGGETSLLMPSSATASAVKRPSRKLSPQ
jgi:aryl-alcohol dehydrogenase-like predicted oxidoreductase